MKNLNLNEKNIRRMLPFALSGIMLMTGSMNVKAESSKVTKQELLNAWLTNSEISGEITAEELEKLIPGVEKAVEEAGINLLPDEFIEQYDLAMKKNESTEKNLYIAAGLCDTLLSDGTAEMMTYPEAIQFDNACEDICEGLMKYGHTSIYSVKQSEKLGEEINIDLTEIMEQADEIRERSRETTITNTKIDAGHYDECFKEDTHNPHTGLNMAPVVGGLALSASAILANLKKKDEKGKTYTKRK